MRVLTLTADYCRDITWSGIGVAVERQACALASLGCEVHVVCPGLPPDAGNPHRHALTRDCFPLGVDRSDTLHVHSLSLSGLACEIQKRFGCRLIYTAHTLPELELPASREGERWSAQQDRLFERADHVFFLNPGDREAAGRRVPGVARRSSVLPHGIPGPSASRNPRRDDARLAAFVGRFAASKGVDTAAATIAALIERGSGWTFVFAGGHGDAAEEHLVRDLVRRYPDACECSGWLRRDELERLYARTSLLLMPSRYEPFGLVALEAMNHGVPVLASSALRYVVRPDSGGQIVAETSPSAWIGDAHALMADDDARARMSARGPEYVRRNFDPLVCARRFLTEIAA